MNIVKSASVLPGGLILEIGCNDGALLGVLREAGFHNLVGVEPSKALCVSAGLTGAKIVNDYFTSESAEHILRSYGAPKAVICRHTLEHVPDIQGFMAGIRRLADSESAVTLIEVPDSSVITDRGYFFELWDEHLYYFHDDNLAHLMAREGFKVAASVAVEHQETRNILMTLRPMQAADVVTAPMSSLAHA
ncbi:MAG: class I SAM-dependent methyltransferase, partial [Betaproteobacteria bacterium]|nr:class I SAM-dependent methyltransferase [Betaproteobacteria bacterium]